MDACHPQHQTKLAYGWIEKGVRKPEKMTACQKRVNLIAGVNVANHHVEYAQAPWINGESIEAFLKQLIAAQPKAKTIHIIWDNAGYHLMNPLIYHCLKYQPKTLLVQAHLQVILVIIFFVPQ